MAYCYFTFPSTYYALKAEKILKEKLVDASFKMVPVPRRISSSCGTALRCNPEKADEIEIILQKQLVKLEGKHLLEEEKIDLKKFLGLRRG